MKPDREGEGDSSSERGGSEQTRAGAAAGATEREPLRWHRSTNRSAGGAAEADRRDHQSLVTLLQRCHTPTLLARLRWIFSHEYSYFTLFPQQMFPAALV